MGEPILWFLPIQKNTICISNFTFILCPFPWNLGLKYCIFTLFLQIILFDQQKLFHIFISLSWQQLFKKSPINLWITNTRGSVTQSIQAIQTDKVDSSLTWPSKQITPIIMLYHHHKTQNTEEFGSFSSAIQSSNIPNQQTEDDKNCWPDLHIKFCKNVLSLIVIGFQVTRHIGLATPQLQCLFLMFYFVFQLSIQMNVHLHCNSDSSPLQLYYYFVLISGVWAFKVDVWCQTFPS